MDSKAIAVHNPGESKQRNARVEGTKRRVLRDIGSLVTGAAVESGKQEVLANKQGEVGKNSKKPLAEVANGAVTKAASHKIEAAKQKPQQVLVSKPGFTSMLTARSKDEGCVHGFTT